MGALKKTKDTPDDRDRIIGLRVKTYREIKGMSQTDLGEYLGVTFQQVQKYESGKNKISVSRLIDVCKILDTPLIQFMTDLYSLHDLSDTPIIALSDVKHNQNNEHPDRNKEVAKLLKVYNSVGAAEHRLEIFNLLKPQASDKKKRSS